MIGTLRHRVILEAPSAADDEGGGRAVSWMPFATVWAHVEATGGRQLERAGELEPQTNYRITIRHLAGVRAGMRINWNGKLIEITGVGDREGRGRTLVLEGVNRSEMS